MIELWVGILEHFILIIITLKHKTILSVCVTFNTAKMLFHMFYMLINVQGIKKNNGYHVLDSYSPA